MFAPLLLSLLSLSRAEAPTLTVTITDPTGAEHVLQGAVPLEGAELLDMGKAAQRLDVRAAQTDTGIQIIGELHEVKGKKDKVVRVATLALSSEGSSRAERLSWGAPKGATVPDGLNPDLLAWRLVAAWDRPEEPAVEEPAVEEESAEESTDGE